MIWVHAIMCKQVLIQGMAGFCMSSIKMPKEYINWTVPEGGGGPSYTLM